MSQQYPPQQQQATIPPASQPAGRGPPALAPSVPPSTTISSSPTSTTSATPPLAGRGGGGVNMMPPAVMGQHVPGGVVMGRPPYLNTNAALSGGGPYAQQPPSRGPNGPQRMPPNNNNNNSNTNNPGGGWQPAVPTSSLQHAAMGGAYPPSMAAPGNLPPPNARIPPNMGGGYGQPMPNNNNSAGGNNSNSNNNNNINNTGGAPMGPGGPTPYYPPNNNNMYGGMPPNQPGGPNYPPRGPWQPSIVASPYMNAPPHHMRGPPGGAPGGAGGPGYGGGGGMFYPPGGLMGAPTGGGAGGLGPPASSQPPHHHYAPPPPREKKPLVITDKHGNVIDFSSSVKKPSTPAAPSSLAVAATAGAKAPAPAPDTPPVVATATTTATAPPNMRQLALERMAEQERNKRAEAERIKKEAEEKVKKEAEEKAKAEAEEKARREEEELALKKAEEEKTRLEAEEKAKVEAEEKARIEAETKAKLEEEERLRREAEEKASQEAEEKAKQKAEELSRQEAEEKDKQEVEEVSRSQADEALDRKSADQVATTSSLAQAALQPPVLPVHAGGRRVFTKQILQQFREIGVCKERPETLPDMTISKGTVRAKSGGSRGGGKNEGGGSGGGGGGGDWSRANAQPRRQSDKSEGGGGQWSRGQAPPKAQNQRNRSKGGRGQPPPLYDGPVAPLVRSENRWRPTKNTSALVVAEKLVKSILNKMTKEKFARLSAQMLEIPIVSYDTLNMMIDNIYDKAIDEPSFGEIYADLCVSLSHTAQENKFIHVIESDEEPPTDDGVEASQPVRESSSHTVYRWSNDVSTSDSEIFGPFLSPEECIDVAIQSEQEQQEQQAPTQRGEMALELVNVCIRSSLFIKVLKKAQAEEGEENVYYVVFFPVKDAKECGQQMSEIFLSHVECVSDAKKKNTFKRALLNKCEEEFNKQDIYKDWKKEKAEYEQTKGSLSDAEKAEKEESLEFRRIKIKKQMLGNVKFIGQLYKKGLLKERIMRYCIGDMLKLTELAGAKGEYRDDGSKDIDEEDHEAICSMFTTIGATIDTPAAAEFMNVCFTKIQNLSNDNELPSRYRFLYKDLLDLRLNRWVPRRKVEKAKTLEEIRKEVEQEEKRKEQESLRAAGKVDFRQQRPGDYRVNRQTSFGGSNRARAPKPSAETDEEGFTTVVVGSKSNTGAQKYQQPRALQQPRAPPVVSKPAFAALAEDSQPPAPSSVSPAEPLSQDLLKRRISSMVEEFSVSGGNVDELMLSMQELAGTPGSAVKVVSQNVDRMMECKDPERTAIYQILPLLFEKGLLSASDVQEGLMDVVEFIDDIVVDTPKAYDYLGTLLGEFLRIGAVDGLWLCEQFQKLATVNPDTQAPEKLVSLSLRSLKGKGGDDLLKSCIDESAFIDLLGPDKWNEIIAAL